MIYDSYISTGDEETYKFLERIHEWPEFKLLEVKIRELKEITCIQCKKTSYENYMAYFCSKECVEKLLKSN